MEPWQQWLAMAHESAQAAKLAEDAGLYRSAVSRYYYAAYQAATSVLLYLGLQTPYSRGAWSHDATPELLREHLSQVITSRDKRSDLARRLADLYSVRVTADYMSDAALSPAKVNTSGKSARYIVDTISILP